MLDWRKIVRGKLGALPLDSGRAEEVIEELGQQLEAAYEEELKRGAGKTEAIRRSMAQFDDWEKLRNELSLAVAGAPLPVWQQRGIFSPKRPWVWTSLLLSLALLAVSSFRQSLVTLSVPIEIGMWGDGFFSARTLARIERQALAQTDSRGLAFVALHHPDLNEAARVAEKAIALDSQLTWISARFARAYPLDHNPAPWIARLKAWDPDNAFPYLLEAEASFEKDARKAGWERRDPLELRRLLASDSVWRLPMQKAFAAPRYDTYANLRFELHRSVFEQQGWDRPDLLLFTVASQPIPNLLDIRTYAEYLVKDLGETAEKAGHNEEAAAQYRTVAQFSVCMQRAPSDIERRIATAILRESYEHLLSQSRLQGRAEEAMLLESSLTDSRDTGGVWARKHRLEDAAASRSAQLVLISGVPVLLFGLGALAWLGSLVLLRWKENANSPLNYFASVAGAAPPLLLLASLSLYAAYYPYARHINQFESASQMARDLMPFWEGLAGFWMGLPLYRGSWLTMMFWPTLWCVVVAIVGAIALRFVATRREADSFREE